jgi:probable rRNA maturation factor
VASRLTGEKTPKLDIRVSFAGERRALSVPAVRRAVTTVLDGQQAGAASVTVTFMSAARMRALNRRTFGRDCATDVIAFSLPHADRLVGDVYVCPSRARCAARRFGVTPREELLRLVVHGTLHVLGHNHPDDGPRTQSPMWERQERYVRGLTGGSP